MYSLGASKGVLVKNIWKKTTKNSIQNKILLKKTVTVIKVKNITEEKKTVTVIEGKIFTVIRFSGNPASGWLSNYQEIQE